MKALVVYYSRTGHTEALAREIAARCGADIERIRDDGVDRSGLGSYLRSGWQAWSGATRPIRRAVRAPGSYELVLIGTPVWNWSLAAPVSVQATVDAPRLPPQWPPEIAAVQPYALNPDTRRLLEYLGRPPGARPVGRQRSYGANDPRRGAALALGC